MAGQDVWLRVLVLSAGGVLGVNARYWLGLWVDRWANPHFPYATVSINVSGCFAIGLIAAALAAWFPHPHLRLFALTGFLGGYTTFSSFALESHVLWQRGHFGLMLLNMVGSVVLGFAAVMAGAAIGRAVCGPPLPPRTQDHIHLAPPENPGRPEQA